MRNLIIITILMLLSVSCGQRKKKTDSVKQSSIVSKSICKDKDTRQLSYDPRVGRALGGGGVCTVTMISRNCGISAGHCKPALDIIEFNTYPSQNGRMVPSNEVDRFRVDKGTIVSVDGGIGNDWSVFKLKKGFDYQSAGTVQGYYGVGGFGIPSVLRIVGYGVDNEPTTHLAQQRGFGHLVSTQGSKLYHNVDTMGGNSGSAIVNDLTDRVIGIHSHGGCATQGFNGGTLISKNLGLQRAIKACVLNDL